MLSGINLGAIGFCLHTGGLPPGIPPDPWPPPAPPGTIFKRFASALPRNTMEGGTELIIVLL